MGGVYSDGWEETIRRGLIRRRWKWVMWEEMVYTVHDKMVV